MASIDRGIDFFELVDDMRDMMRRRLAEIGGAVLIGLAALIAPGVGDVVGSRPVAQSHATDQPGAQLARHARRDRRRPNDAAVRSRSDRVILPVAVWGSRHRDRPGRSIASGFALDFQWVIGTPLPPQPAPPACRAPHTGRCRPAWAAWWATPCGSFQSWRSAR